MARASPMQFREVVFIISTVSEIAVMGCIVNGPGEMADADYGYVGAARGKVSLYRRKECVERNIPEDEAVAHLLALIKSDREGTQA